MCNRAAKPCPKEGREYRAEVVSQSEEAELLVRWQEFGWAGIAGMGVFVLLVIETLVYVWKRGALDWNVAHRERYRRVVAPIETVAENSNEEAA